MFLGRGFSGKDLINPRFKRTFALPLALAFTRAGLRVSIVAASIVLGGSLYPGTGALALSNRCPNDVLAQGDASPTETVRATDIWKKLHGPGLDGGDGPLGCPIGNLIKFEDQTYTFKGVGQKFQRGWILIGHGNSAGSEIAVVRGLDTWTVWTKGLPALLRDGAELAFPYRSIAAASEFGGSVATIPKSAALTLFKCKVTDFSFVFGVGCVQITPELNASGRPFDFAAHLDLDTLSTPSANARMARTKSAFSDWLACFTLSPDAESPSQIDEDTIAHAIVMLQRDTACPLTNVVPRDVVRTWLQSLGLPEGMVPGTSSDDHSTIFGACPQRRGELDVLLVQLVNLTFKFRTLLQGAPLARIETVFVPWGGPPRDSPYITSYLCYGYAVIETENHILLQETARYLINALRGELNTSNRDWLVKFMQQIVRRDFYEFNALPYTRYQMKALFALADYAPDKAVKDAASGALDWMFAKLALSGNLDRDHRPYRRRPDDGILGEKAWWSSSINAATTAASIFVGPTQHVHDDLDLQLDRDAGTKALLDPTSFPDLGTASEYFGAALVDASNTSYMLPEALVGWFERRFTAEDSNRLTYVQGIHHHSPIADDPALFLQENSGAELVSGNRNWTIIGGGVYAQPGYLPTPPSANSVLIDLFGDTKANKKQLDTLWDDQPGVLRETILITSAVGMSRQQTIRFGGSEKSARDRNGQGNRLCVAEGFMCGFDLRMPDRPFPSSDALNCPFQVLIPPGLIAEFQKYVGTGKSITELLGCLVKRPGLASGWRIWTFEHGMLALPEFDAQQFLGAWIENRVEGKGGRLRVAWNTR